MKKLALFIIAAVIIVCSFGLVGCGKDEKKSDDVVLADFEKWAPDFQIMRPMNNFGVVSQNSDTKYVKSGAYSAKLQPMGGYSKMTVPYVYFNFSSEHFDYDYTDMTEYEYISLHLYNAQSVDKTVDIGFITGIADISTAEKLKGMTVTLKPGWNEIDYFPELSLVNISYDVTGILGLYIEFENAGVRDKKDAPVYYLDDIVLHKAKNPIEVEDIVTLSEGEICDFEKTYQKYILSADVANPKCIPDMSVVTAESEGITAPSGSKVMKLVTRPGDAQNATWPKFTLPEKIVRKSGFMKIAKEKWGEYVFKFEVYAVGRAITFYPEFYSENGGNWTATNVAPKTGQWVTYEKSFTEFKDDVLANPGYIKIAWGEYPGTEELTFYFDNFRFEKKA